VEKGLTAKKVGPPPQRQTTGPSKGEGGIVGKKKILQANKREKLKKDTVGNWEIIEKNPC